jgi:hypothetical protein
MSRETTLTVRLTPVALAVLLVLLGCANTSSSRAATRTLPVVQVGDQRDGGTVALHVGQRLRVVLHSTYWELTATAGSRVLRLVGTPVVAPKSGCVPGQGCGTVTALYVARAAGTTVVRAERTSCGEAMACTGDAGSYTVTVIVRR